MADEKKKKKKAAPKPKVKTERQGDVRIVIGAKGDVPQIQGIQTWVLDGEEVTSKGDRSSCAYLTTQELFALGWIRRKF